MKPKIDEGHQECTFKPSLKKPLPKHLKHPDSDDCVEKRLLNSPRISVWRQVAERLWKKAQDKADMTEKRKAEILQRKERKELKECTFTPNIRYHVPKTKVNTGRLSCTFFTFRVGSCGDCRFGKILRTASECSKNERESKKKRRENLSTEIGASSMQVYDSDTIQSYRQ